MTAVLGPGGAVAQAAVGTSDFDGDDVAATLRRNFGTQAALRVLVRDAAGRLRTTFTHGSWPEEADAMSVARRRPAFERAAELEIRLPSPAGTVLLLLPMVLKDEAVGIVEILAPRAAVAKHRAALPAFVESIATRCRIQPRVSEHRSNGRSLHSGTQVDERSGSVTQLRSIESVSSAADLHGIRVLIVDKHKLFAEVIRSVLEERGAEVLQPVDAAAEALVVARRTHPDLVLIDLALNGSAMGLGRDIRKECPHAKVIGLTAVTDPIGQGEVLRSGFHGYLTKDMPLERFVSAVRAALEGDLVVSHEPSRWTPPSRTKEECHAAMLGSHLTPREREVLAQLVEGMSGEDIARRLSASSNTVRTHIQSILAKLQVHSRLQAAAFAVRNGLVRIPGDTSYTSNADRQGSEGTPHPLDMDLIRSRKNGQRYRNT